MMVLIDVYNKAMQECTKASPLVADTNEFYNNHVTSNGTTYSVDLHTCTLDGAFLTLFMALENFLESSFVCYMMGQAGLNGNSFAKYVSPASEENAHSILKGISKFTDFTNRDTIVKLANNFFDGGGTYVYLNSISTDFEDMKKIRNAISHISVESDRAFKGLVRTKLGSIPPNISTSLFLNTTVPGTTTTFFIYYRNIVIDAVRNISNPT